jgi:natural product precursor
MKKVESLKLSKFKKQELTKEGYNAILGGRDQVTHKGSCDFNDNYNDASKYYNKDLGQYMWPSSDVAIGSSVGGGQI